MMRSFFRHSREERRLLLRSLALVWVVRLALWILPFKLLRGLVEKGRPPQSEERPADFVQERKIASSVRRASRYVPAASCLTQAMATQVLLSRIGAIGLLRIGVAKGPEGRLDAHAWVESNGKIIIGKKRDLRRYTVLSQLEDVTQ